jgi:hypothetical protein
MPPGIRGILAFLDPMDQRCALYLVRTAEAGRGGIAQVCRIGLSTVLASLAVPGCSNPSGVQSVPILPVQVSVSGPTQVRLNASVQLTSVVANAISSGVIWQVNGIAGGNAALGLISSSGSYSAPANIPTTNPVTITAVSVASPTASASLSEYYRQHKLSCRCCGKRVCQRRHN